MKRNGWLINADLVIAESILIESRIQKIRVDGIVHRANEKDPRFISYDSTRQFLDQLEEKENDQPLNLNQDLKILKHTGFQNIDILWKEYREVILCAQKV